MIPFFDKYKCVFFKSTLYEIWKNILFLMEEKYHLTSNGFYIIPSLVYLINRFPKKEKKLEEILISHETKYGNCEMVFPKTLKEKQILLNKLCIYHLLKKDYYILSKKYNNFFVSGLIDKDKGFSLSF